MSDRDLSVGEQSAEIEKGNKESDPRGAGIGHPQRGILCLGPRRGQG